jgi:hypothetical protein
MTIDVEAIDEGGVLKLRPPLDLPERFFSRFPQLKLVDPAA